MIFKTLTHIICQKIKEISNYNNFNLVIIDKFNQNYYYKLLKHDNRHVTKQTKHAQPIFKNVLPALLQTCRDFYNRIPNLQFRSFN